VPRLQQSLGQLGIFSRGAWRYWRHGKPSPESNYVVQKLYALTDGRSNDILFRFLDSKRRETTPDFAWANSSLVSPSGSLDPTIHETVRTLREDGVAVLPRRLDEKAIRDLVQLSLSCQLATKTFAAPPANGGLDLETPVAETGTSGGFDPARPAHSVYTVPREALLENQTVQRLLCDPYLLSAATRYLGVFPVVTKPDMWWDTDVLPAGLRPRPFHTDSGCLRWLKVGINLTETTVESPHFVFVKGSHNPNRASRPLTKRLSSRMNLTDQEVQEVCSDKVVHVTAPAGSITLADTRGIHKGELSQRGNRLILYFGLEGSAFNNIDKPMPLTKVGPELGKAMTARPFSYQFFRVA
jgi:hypothetical protein